MPPCTQAKPFAFESIYTPREPLPPRGPLDATIMSRPSFSHLANASSRICFSVRSWGRMSAGSEVSAIAVAFSRRPLKEQSGEARQRLSGGLARRPIPAQAILPDVEPQRGWRIDRGIGFAVLRSVLG